jgi:putative transposase
VCLAGSATTNSGALWPPQVHLLGLLDSEPVADMALASFHPTLLVDGRYYSSIRTMNRLLALAPNEVWRWDITKLKDVAKRSCFQR